jgi:hypothetical protein
MIMLHDRERSQLIDLLELATAKLQAGPDQTQPEDPEPAVDWLALVTGVLELPIRYLPAVQQALAQGRWRKAKNPKAYIRTVAKRTLATDSRRDPKSTLEIPKNVCDEEGQPLSYQDYIDYQSYDYGPVKVGGRWKARNPLDEPIWADEEGREIPAVDGRPVPEDLLMLEDDEPDAKLVIHWQKVAERAGLDDEEAMILGLRGVGATREAILSRLAQDDEQRRKYQAAWRRLDRNRDRVRAVFFGPEKKCA